MTRSCENEELEEEVVDMVLNFVDFERWSESQEGARGRWVTDMVLVRRVGSLVVNDFVWVSLESKARTLKEVA